MPAPRNNPYQQAQKLGSNPRETESRALLEAARRLDAVQRADADIEQYRSALRLNWRLWTLFQADIAEDSNPLPPEIKQNMLSLAGFVDRHTVSALGRVAPERLQVLIDINRNIALGLSGQRTDGTVAAPAQPASTAPMANRFVA
ncbi:MAG: flagellar biosynthesis regulator FlaF [Alphaproteobacteria bacterium]